MYHIRCDGVEQAIRMVAILLDMAGEHQRDFDELFIERNSAGRYWLHFVVRPPYRSELGTVRLDLNPP